MLQLTATGNIGKDATLSKSGNDTAINFSVATNRKYTNAQNVVVEETKWIDCTIWRKQGESLDIAQYLKAGTKVLVQGEPDVRWYVNGNGEVVTVQTLRVRSQELLSSKKEEAPVDTTKHKPGLPASLLNPGVDRGPAAPASSLPASSFEEDAKETPAAPAVTTKTKKAPAPAAQ